MAGPPKFLDQNPPKGDPQTPPPYRFEGVGVRIFPLRAKWAALEAVCDYFLNGPAQDGGLTVTFEPLPVAGGTGVVYLEILQYEKGASTAPGYKDLGYTSQNELVFAIPIVERDRGTVTRVGLFVPALFVDNDWSLIGGREVMGYPKLEGWFRELPKKLVDIYPTRIDARVIEKAGPNSKAEPDRLVEIRPFRFPFSPFRFFRRAVAPPDVVEGGAQLWPFGPVDDLYGAQGLFPVEEEILRMLHASAGLQVWNLQLKQFRDAEKTDLACYQALVSFTTTLSGATGGPLLSNPIKIYEYDSMKIATRLGLDISGNEVTPKLPSWIHGNFDLTGAKNLCSTCISS